jgi:ATP-dependent helicase/nuclease subunit A
VKRELRFNVALDAENFSSDPASAERLRGEKLLVQGVIDCLYEDQDGTLTVLDYKTDYMPAAFRGREEEFGDLLRERHRDQLNYYGAAAEIITGRPVGRRLIWSFAAGRAFEL